MSDGVTRVLVTGASGMIGRSLVTLLEQEPRRWQVMPRTREGLDLADVDRLDDALDDIAPGLIFNCGAVTGVDRCESDQDFAHRVNAEAPGALARWCATHDARLVHLSTDYVFDGSARAPISEDAPTAPLGVYGLGKLEAEQRIAAAGGDWLIVRSAWVFAEFGRNFLTFVLDGLKGGRTLPIVTDQIGSPTYARDLAGALIQLVVSDARGMVHFVNAGVCSWLELAEHLRACAELDGEFCPVRAEELGRPAPRPAYSALDTSRYTQLVGTSPRLWQDAAADAVRRWQARSSPKAES